LFSKIFVTDEAIEKTKPKFSCTDEAIKLVKFCAIKRHFCLCKQIFLAMKRYNWFRNLFFEAMQPYNIRRYKSFTNEATRSPSIFENVSITAILHILLFYRKKKKTSVNLTIVAKNIAQQKIYLFFRNI
jgi:hypothetical protein